MDSYIKKKESCVSDKKLDKKDKMPPAVDQNPVMKYQKMHQSLLVANKKLLHKLNVLQRQSSFWKRQHRQLVKTIWGWTLTTPPSKDTLWTMIPDTNSDALKKKRKRNAAGVGFTFPSEVPHSPERNTNIKNPTGSNLEETNIVHTPEKRRLSKEHKSSTRRSKRLSKQPLLSLAEKTSA